MDRLKDGVSTANSLVFQAMLCSLVSIVGCHAAQKPEDAPGSTGAGWTADPSPMVLESVRVAAAPVLDGQVEEMWSKARPLTVHVREAMGGDHPRPVVLRAIHTSDSFFLLARWPDATRSDMRDPFVWNKEKQAYDRPSGPDDQFAIQFPMTEDFAISMLTVMHSFRSDVWHWKAGRGNPIGWVDDKVHVISQTPIDDPKAVKHDIYGGRTVYILRAQDAGTSPYKPKDRPAQYEGDLVDSFQQQEPAGSMADVRGKGVHDGKGWTLEMGRKFNTGHPDDDAVIDPKADNRCAIAVLDDELYEEHSVSSLILLRFADAEAEAPRDRKDGARAWTWRFDDAAVGRLPEGWKIEGTNQRGPLATWTVKVDDSAPSMPKVLALADPKDGSSGTFNLCWSDRVMFQDGVIEVKVKAGGGRVDQGGGPIWRVLDKDDYYIARWNPLEDNFRLYGVKDGARRMLDSADVKADPAAWHTIRIEQKGDEIKCYLDGKELLRAQDKTFPGAGGVGLWTKADAATSFDDLIVDSDGR